MPAQVDKVNQHVASGIAFEPTAGISATNVQDAIEEVEAAADGGGGDFLRVFRALSNGGGGSLEETGDYIASQSSGDSIEWDAGTSEVTIQAAGVYAISLIVALYDAPDYAAVPSAAINHSNDANNPLLRIVTPQRTAPLTIVDHYEAGSTISAAIVVEKASALEGDYSLLVSRLS